jgi:hypothetical protein
MSTLIPTFPAIGCDMFSVVSDAIVPHGRFRHSGVSVLFGHSRRVHLVGFHKSGKIRVRHKSGSGATGSLTVHPVISSLLHHTGKGEAQE